MYVKLRHTNHRNAQFYNFFKNNNICEGRQINIKIISHQFMNGVCSIHSDGYANFRSLTLSRLSFLFRVITIIFLYLLSTIIVCNIKKNIYSALILSCCVPHTQPHLVIVSSCLHFS